MGSRASASSRVGANDSAPAPAYSTAVAFAALANDANSAASEYTRPSAWPSSAFERRTIGALLVAMMNGPTYAPSRSSNATPRFHSIFVRAADGAAVGAAIFLVGLVSSFTMVATVPPLKRAAHARVRDVDALGPRAAVARRECSRHEHHGEVGRHAIEARARDDHRAARGRLRVARRLHVADPRGLAADVAVVRARARARADQPVADERERAGRARDNARVARDRVERAAVGRVRVQG